MKKNTKENLQVAAVVGIFSALLAACAAVDESSGAGEARRRREAKDRVEARRSLKEQHNLNRRPSDIGDLLSALAGQKSDGEILVERIQAMDDDMSKRALLRDWVRSGRGLTPIEAADVRQCFFWMSSKDEDTLRIAVGL